MSVPGHTLILASAGTGKTFQLTNRFLALLASGALPERILGTTFTRKAAGEILDRILERLAKAAGDEGERAALVEHLEGVSLDRNGCRLLLGQLVRSIDRFQIETLDAFFLRVAMVFGLELGLPPGWQLIDDHDDVELRSEAVSRVLESADTQQIMTLLGALQSEAEGRSVHGALLRHVNQGHDVASEASPAAWEALALPQPRSDDDVQSLLAALEEADLPLTKAGKENKRWLSAVEELVATVHRGDWTGILDAGLGKALAAGTDTFYRQPIPPAVRGPVAGLVAHAGAKLLARKANEARAWRDLLTRFEAAYSALKRERRAYRFDDLPRALGGRGAAALPPWRMGGAVDHLLLDEFQDTSVAQWRILGPLAERIVGDTGGERSFFCVGDVKQSIYGWRGGEPRLLDGLAERLDGLEVKRLAKSYRSSRVVLQTVNRVFGRLPELDVMADEAVSLAVARRWHERYEEHTTERSELPGWAALHEVPVGDVLSPRRREIMVRRVAEHVRQLVTSAPSRTIGVLVRKRARIAPLIYELRKLGIRASDEGGNPLVDSEAVLVALSLLHLADHPGDSMAWFHVASSPLACLLEVELVDREADRRSARQLSGRMRRQLLVDGYGPTLASLADAVAAHPGWDGWDEGRFAQLVDAAFAWDERAGLRPSEFVRFVEQTKVEDPTSSAVQVMTVHAAKGLEFDAVVLPELDGDIEPRNKDDPLLFRRREPTGPIDLVFPRVGRSLAGLLPELDELLRDTRARTVEEELCVLYVAMTRAVLRLDLFVPSVVGKSDKRDQATLLRQALQAGDAAEQGLVWCAPGSVASWADEPANGDGAAAIGDASVEPAEDELRLLPTAARRELRRRSPSGLEGGRTIPAAELLRPLPAAARARGLVVHRWMAEIEWLESFDHDDARLLALAREALADAGHVAAPGELAAWLAEFRRWLAAPGVSSVLRRDAPAPALAAPARGTPATGTPATAIHAPAAPAPAASARDAPVGPVQGELFVSPRPSTAPAPGVPAVPAVREVWRERAFALRLVDDDGEPVLVSGAFDRVVLTRDSGGVASAEVIDFKTDRVDGPVPAELLGRYRPQMDEYRRVLATLAALPVEAVGAKLVFLAADAVVDVGG